MLKPKMQYDGDGEPFSNKISTYTQLTHVFSLFSFVLFVEALVPLLTPLYIVQWERYTTFRNEVTTHTETRVCIRHTNEVLIRKIVPLHQRNGAKKKTSEENHMA